MTVFPLYVNVVKERPQTGEQYPSREHITSLAVETLDSHAGTLTFLATLAIAFFTLTLKRSTDRLWDEAKEQRKESGRAADAADLQQQWAGQQTEIARQQKQILRLEHYATHRPILVIKDVFIPRAGETEPRVTYEIVNKGGSEAKILDGFVAVDFVTDERDFKNPNGRSAGATFEEIFAPGTLKQFSTVIPNDADAFLSRLIGYNYFPELKRIRDDDHVSFDRDLFFFGFLQYCDDRGGEERNEYLAVFRRVWSKVNSRFERTGNPDHEYSE